MDSIRLIDCMGFYVCGGDVIVNSIRLIDCMGFCCV